MTHSYRTPGQLIEALLKERGWNNRILATVLEVDETGISKLIATKKAVTPAIAISLEEVFGVPADEFLRLQRNFDLAHARIVSIPRPERARRAQLFADFPIAELVARRWIQVDDPQDVVAIELALQNFMAMRSDAGPDVLTHAARKTSPLDKLTPAQLAWLLRVRQIAMEIVVPRYDEGALKAALPRLKALLSAPEEARHVPRILQDCGIRLVIVEGLKSSKVDGVCCWLNERSPVIGMTLRYDRMDNFWFVLRHEIEHVICKHGMAEPLLDIDMKASDEIVEEERIANAAAADFCATSAKVESFIARKAPIFPERDFLGLSKILGVHPCLVAGQIQFRTGRHDLFRGHLVKIREHILPSAIVDGWGDVAPVANS